MRTFLVLEFRTFTCDGVFLHVGLPVKDESFSSIRTTLSLLSLLGFYCETFAHQLLFVCRWTTFCFIRSSDCQLSSRSL